MIFYTLKNVIKVRKIEVDKADGAVAIAIAQLFWLIARSSQ